MTNTVDEAIKGAETAMDRYCLNRYGATKPQLEAAFNKVANHTNWKYPIDKTIKATEDEALLTLKAIEFYAGGHGEFVPAGPGAYRITAPGYYALIGA